jgi:hypothetical protein
VPWGARWQALDIASNQVQHQILGFRPMESQKPTPKQIAQPD